MIDCLPAPNSPYSQAMKLFVAMALLGLTFAAPLSAQDERPEAQQAADSVFSRPPLTPGGAFIRSLVIPGWAQAELGAKTRGAFYFLAEAFSILMVARTQIRLSHTERAEPWNEGLIDARKQQKEDWIALAVFTAFFSAADGWVSVHLWGFDERTGLEPEGISAEVSFTIPFAP